MSTIIAFSQYKPAPVYTTKIRYFSRTYNFNSQAFQYPRNLQLQIHPFANLYSLIVKASVSLKIIISPSQDFFLLSKTQHTLICINCTQIDLKAKQNKEMLQTILQRKVVYDSQPEVSCHNLGAQSRLNLGERIWEG